ncbi:MAG: glycoside hydrolase family 20 zincin-like fold domain-containing protein, partial [Polaribacter sp.]|nr:glycoside hydrolase family 20 zincin-like fold domain-containing protein [Polaribacter sp.]
MKQLSLLTLFLLNSIYVLGQEYALIPYPSSVITKKENAFELSKASVIYYSDDELKNDANYLQNVLNSATNFKLIKTPLTGKVDNGAIILSLEKLKKATKASYSLEISDSVIRISASESRGVFYGIQTL